MDARETLQVKTILQSGFAHKMIQLFYIHNAELEKWCGLPHLNLKSLVFFRSQLFVLTIEFYFQKYFCSTWPDIILLIIFIIIQ